MASHFNSSPPAADHPKGRRWGLPAWAWLGAVALYFAWEATAYRGLFAWAAEWQFARLGYDFPILTLGALVALFGWPALLLRRRTEPVADDGMTVARGSMHGLFGLAAGFALATAVALGWTLFLPDGRAALPADVRLGRTAWFGRDVLLLRQHAFYAPVLPAAGERGGIRTFVELAPDRTGPVGRGILVRADVPGPLTQLYRNLGYRVAARPATLYASAATLRRPYDLAAIQFAFAAAVLFGAGLWHQRQVHRLERVRALVG